ncbi:heat shock 70 kDa protein 18-like [Silene latifolia]|uniref:heat shock 70 kDa protein 18-like n=1 Tax=Silene latifolia TaxID=37657 RepID=UPI003D772739
MSLFEAEYVSAGLEGNLFAVVNETSIKVSPGDFCDLARVPEGGTEINPSVEWGDGILTVSAEQVGTKNKKQMTITNHSARLSKREIDRLVKEGDKYKAQDETFKEAVMAKTKLENYVYEVKKKVSVSGAKIDLGDKRKVDDAIEQTEQWLDWNNMFGEARIFEEKTEGLKNIWEPVYKKMRTGDATTSRSGMLD